MRRQGDSAYSGFIKEVPRAERKELVLWFQEDLVLSYRSRLGVIARDLRGPIIAGIDALIEDFAEIVEWLDAHP